jgi:hypothetical protein
MTNEKKGHEEEIVIDYENIDVDEIMAQIRKRIGSQPKKPEPAENIPLEYLASTGPTAPRSEESMGRKYKWKNLALKLMRPFSPLIKFLVLPVHQELRETIQNLYTTNQRLDALEEMIGDNLSRIHEEFQAVNRRLKELNRVREYVRLLHNLSHNIVVELTKLKLEEENLRITTRILEKDFEFLGRREKALEKKFFE